MPRRVSEREIRAIEAEMGGVLTDDQITDDRLFMLREWYATGRLDLTEFERCVEQALQGRQPVNVHGLPFMPDPALNVSPFPSPVMEVVRW